MSDNVWSSQYALGAVSSLLNSLASSRQLLSTRLTESGGGGQARDSDLGRLSQAEAEVEN